MFEVWKDCELGQTYKVKELPTRDEADNWVETHEACYPGWHLRVVENPAAEDWKNGKRSVTLTNQQWSRLVTYLLISTQYRAGELDAWAKLAAEKNEDGSPRFEGAERNVQFWESMMADIDTIREAIDGVG